MCVATLCTNGQGFKRFHDILKSLFLIGCKIDVVQINDSVSVALELFSVQVLKSSWDVVGNSEVVRVEWRYVTTMNRSNLL